ncbi:putative Xaa-Pro aminopeptidase P [Vitis vinifera]|uniref:Putative Xaa-Pro aminopeptidase P n=1 Tax=Vitis vinifera TaxID=29760 RepID=A0A438CIS3_VITVI|nr:putative Xaa-Pro aminopeptidase P [Vitis vinifera]
MEENGIEVREYGEVSSDVALLVSNQLRPSPVTDITENDINEEEEKTCGFIWVDPGSCCYALYSKLDSDKVVLQQSPLAIAKAIKNPVELDGLRKAHIRDGAAVVQYLVWLDKQMQENYGAAGYFLEVESKNKKQQSSYVLFSLLILVLIPWFEVWVVLDELSHVLDGVLMLYDLTSLFTSDTN